MVETDVLVLGGGLAGLATAHRLGQRAIVLEREHEPGGLVRSMCLQGYWFDLAVHLLYFADADTEAFVRALPGLHLADCPPEAFVETAAGVARYPIQTHLGTLTADAVAACVRDFKRTAETPASAPDNFRDFLRQSFGTALCELFFFPYNEKLWKRPLSELAPSGFQWNIERPNLDAVLAGAAGARRSAYNSSGFYPRPPAGASVRGIAALSRALAAGVARLEVGVRATAVDLAARRVIAQDAQGPLEFRYREALVTTLPITRFVDLCVALPDVLREGCRKLASNRVRSVCVAVRGPRPENTGHWRYYTDRSLIFHRLVYPHVFDPLAAPESGFGLLAEISELDAAAPASAVELERRVLNDLLRVGALRGGDEVLRTATLNLEPAYVVFGLGHDAILAEASSFLARHAVHLVGRYARWEYTSMAQVIRDGLALGNLIAAHGEPS